jgi:hypothetical protein
MHAPRYNLAALQIVREEVPVAPHQPLLVATSEGEMMMKRPTDDANEAAWAIVARATEEALSVPGQTALNRHELHTMLGTCWGAAGVYVHENDGHRQCSYYWRSLALAAREQLVLDYLADRGANTGQIAEALVGHKVYRENVAMVLKELLRKGEVQRKLTPGYNGGRQSKWQYTRNADLSGDIADLERAFHDGEPGKAA